MSFTLWDREDELTFGLPYTRPQCVCSPTNHYCAVCKEWDRQQKRTSAEFTTVCFADGVQFDTKIPKRLIEQVHALKSQGWPLKTIADELSIKHAKVRLISRMTILEEE
jgi:hypothetical protein